MKRKATKVPCPICGGLYYKSGLVGHMRFKHGRDYKAPMLPVKKPIGISEARQKAAFADDIMEPLPANLRERWRDPVFRQEFKELIYKLALETFKQS